MLITTKHPRISQARFCLVAVPVLLILMILAGCAPLPANTDKGEAATAGNAVPACPIPTGSESSRLYGTWNMQIEGQPDGVLELRRHPEYPGSVSGTYTRHSQDSKNGKPPQVSHVAGDVDQGVFTLEESADGKTTSGRWSGQWMPPGCASEIQGNWIDASKEQAVVFPGDNKSQPTSHTFTMRRTSGW